MEITDTLLAAQTTLKQSLKEANSKSKSTSRNFNKINGPGKTTTSNAGLNQTSKTASRQKKVTVPKKDKKSTPNFVKQNILAAKSKY